MASEEHYYHAVQFYENEESLAKTVANFLADGMMIGQPALLIATPEHTAAISEELTASGQDLFELRKRGELHVVDARKMLRAFMVGGQPDSGRFKATLGDLIEKLCAGRKPCPIRAYGEMVDLLWRAGNAEGAIRLEVLWNQLASTYDFALLCGYAVGHFYKETHDPRFQQVCDQHSHVIPAA